jgi:uncharacterized protein DUF4178
MANWDELAALRPGDALRYEDEEFVVERTIRFQEGVCIWFEHRLSSDGTGRSLWLEIPADPDDSVIAYDSSETLDFVPDGGPEIEHGGERLPLLMSGRASYRSVERSAASKTGELVYHEYALGDRRVTYECRSHDSVWEVSEGRAIDAAAIEILT